MNIITLTNKSSKATRTSWAFHLSTLRVLDAMNGFGGMCTDTRQLFILIIFVSVYMIWTGTPPAL